VALADATVRVILDVSRFDRDLQAKVASSARKAGRTFESEFTKTARQTGTRWAKDFDDQSSKSMAGSGTRTGTVFGNAVRRSAAPTGRQTGVNLGTYIRSGLLSTASSTGQQFGRNMFSNTVGVQLGQRLGRAVGANVNASGVGARLRQSIEDDSRPGILAAARTIASRFGTALSTAMGAISIGRFGFLASAITALVSEGTQLAAALAPALQAIGLIPAAAAVAGASVATLVVAFKGMGDALSAAASGDPKKLSEALKNLSPAAASVVREFAKLSPRLKEIKTQVQQAFFKELTGDVTRLGQALLGPVQRGMTATAGAAGRMTSGLLEVLSTSRNAGTIQEVFNSAASAFDRMAAPLQKLTQGMLDWIRATLPAFDQLIGSLGAGATKFGSFLSQAAASGQAMAWVNEAITTLSQLGRIAGSAGRLIGTIFDAANQAGVDYLLNINNALISTRNFLAAGEGQTALVSIFQGLHQVVQALAEPLKAAVVALGQLAPVAGSVAKALSSGVADAIRGIGQAISNAGPGLTKFAQAIGGVLSDLGAVLPSVGASLGKLLGAVSPLVSIFGLVARAGAALLSMLTSLPSGMLTVIAAFVGLRALGVPNMFQAIQTRIGSLGGAAGSLGGTVSSLGSRWQSLTTSFQNNLLSLTATRINQQSLNNQMSSGIPTVSAFGAAMGSLSDRARAAGQTLGGPLMAAGRNLIGMLGGGVGIALTAASVLIGLWTDSQQKAQQAVQEHNNRVAQLAGTLDKTTGSITAATRAQARQTFAQGDLGDAARRLGLSIDQVADAATRNVPAQQRLNSVLQDSSVNVLRTSDRFTIGRQEAERYGLSLDTVASAARGNKAAQDEVSSAVNRYASSLGVMQQSEFDAAGSTDLLIGLAKEMIPDQIALGDAANKTADDLQKQSAAILKANAAFGPTQRLAESLADAMETLASNSSSAADKARALDSALRLLNGGTVELSDAQKASADAVAQGNDGLQQLIAKYGTAGKSAKQLGLSTAEFATRQGELGKALFDSSGQIDFNSERARALYDVSKNLRQATLDQTAAIIDNAQKTGGDMVAAHQKAQDVMAAAREQAIKWARQLGFGEEDAKHFADALGLIPDNVKIALTMPGVPAILQQLGEIKGRIELLPDKKSLRLDSNAAPMRGELEKLGFTVEEIPGSKDIKVTPNTQEAGVALKEFISSQITSRDPDLVVGANIDPAKASAEDIRKFIETLPASFTPKLDPGPIKGQVADLLNTLLAPGQPQVTPGLNPGPAQQGLNGLLLPLPGGTPLVVPGVNSGPAERGLTGLLAPTPKGQPEITPGVNGKGVTSWFNSFLPSLLPPAGQPQITPGVNPGPAQKGLDGLLLPMPMGQPQVTPSAFTAPARAQLQGLVAQINATTTTGPTVNGNVGPASVQLVGLINRINTSTGNVNVGANTGGAYGGVSALVGWISRNGASVGVGANTGGAYGSVDALVRYINSKVATITVKTTTPPSIQAAEGGIFRYFRSGGISSMRSMPANRAEIVPPGVQRVIGDRATGDEAFIPLVNSARSRAIFRAAASRLGFDVTPSGTSSQRAIQTSTTTIEPGAIVVNAPQSDPRLVARAVLNELVREAVV
jgi:hypothetical protein